MMYTVTIPYWKPASVNRLINAHWTTGSRAKLEAVQMIATYLYKSGVPKATGRRKVDISITQSGRGRTLDPDNLCKVVFDALKSTGYIIDDSSKWLDYTPPVITRGKVTETTITLTDVTICSPKTADGALCDNRVKPKRRGKEAD